MFKEMNPNVSFPALEQGVAAFWRERDIFRKSLEKDAPRGNYVFYEGPPTANGQPGMHHVISRAFKDLFPRFKTMQGYHAGRKGGWDTHGLPVEIAVEKRLGVLGRKTLSRDEIAEFNKLCKAYVFENIEEWSFFTERMGFWVDLEHAYISYTNEYIESVWNLLKRLWDKGLLVQDYKVVPLSPRISSTLSAGEIAEGYREVDDPSIYVRFPLKTETTPEKARQKLAAQGVELENLDSPAILVWTTTPWTLPSNTMAAVNPEMDYALVRSSAGDLILAEGAVARVAELLKEPLEVLAHLRGADLEGWEYTPPFPEVGVELGILKTQGEKREDGKPVMHFVALADFVSADDGSGVAHEAPVYGADDLELARAYGVPLLFGTDEHGIMQVTDEKGKFFKDADKGLIEEMKARGAMLHSGTVRHRYPFHDRTGDPILYFAKPSWYIKTSLYREQLYACNEQINWVPENIKHGRFGNWLAGNVDWAISRERYWGAPLPFWVSEDSKDQICVGSVKELAELTGKDLADLELHRPYVDDLTFEKNGKLYRRIPEVLDVWFESGAMPYAQWGLLVEDGKAVRGGAEFAANFPADYICEAIDQTRGWFYSLHAIATLLYASPAFKNVISLGHLVDEQGRKMSKSKGNAVEPLPLFERYGADAVRWYCYSSSPAGATKRFSENLVAEVLRNFFMTLWNTASFFVLYANLDQPALTEDAPVAQRPEIDRWLASKTHALIRGVTEKLEAYDATGASRALRDFVVDGLSNWYVRRNRRRFWKSENDADKLAAYKTLYEALVTVSRLMAPLAPFTGEALYRNLVFSVTPDAPESVHLASWPSFDAALIDETLLRDMNALQRVVELGRGARAASGLKTRQPLPEVLVRAPSEEELAGLKRLEPQLTEELNVKSVTYLDVHAEFVDYTVKPNLPLVGKRLGKRVPELRKKLASLDVKAIARNVREGQETVIELSGEPVTFEPEAFLLEAKSPEGYAATEERGYLAALNTQLSPELIQEGKARDVIRLVQNARKNAGLEVSDYIELGLEANGELGEVFETYGDTIQSEVLARELRLEALPDASYQETAEVEGTPLGISLRKAAACSRD
jgi:isoleucyl-tRNA synthetase